MNDIDGRPSVSDMAQGGAVSHTLGQHLPLKSLHWSYKIYDWQTKGKTRVIIRMEGNREEAILKIYNEFKQMRGNRYWGREARLQGSENNHRLVDSPQILQ